MAWKQQVLDAMTDNFNNTNTGRQSVGSNSDDKELQNDTRERRDTRSRYNLRRKSNKRVLRDYVQYDE